MLSGLRESVKFCFQCGTRLPGPVPVTCSGCGLEHYANPKVCAGALMLSRGRVALVRRSLMPYRGHWDIPGGFCEAGEHPARTAVREVREELGWDIEITGQLGAWVDTYDDPSGVTYDTLNIYYCAEAAGDLVTALDRENSEWAFFGLAELPAELAFPRHIGPVLSALAIAAARGNVVTPLYDIDK